MDKGNKKQDFRDNAITIGSKEKRNSDTLDVSDIVITLGQTIDKMSPNLPLEVRTNALGEAAVIAREEYRLRDNPNDGIVLNVAFAKVRGGEYNFVNMLVNPAGEIVLTDEVKAGSEEAAGTLDALKEYNSEAIDKGYRSVTLGRSIELPAPLR